MLLAIVQLECLTDDGFDKAGEHVTRTFDGVTKDYADTMAERFRALKVNATVDKR